MWRLGQKSLPLGIVRLLKIKLTAGPVLPLPPVLIELTQDKQAFHRYTPYQVISMFPSLLVDSVVDPLPAVQVAAMLMGGLHDPSVDVRVEAIKAVEAVITGSFTSRERAQVGPEMAEACFTVCPLLDQTDGRRSETCPPRHCSTP